jgi:hypothetical protein
MVSPGEAAMSRRIAELVGESEKAVGRLLAGLEEYNGYPSHDARYIADTHQQLRVKLQELKLDPDDTTAEELFHALQTKFEIDAKRLDRYFNADQKDFDGKAALAAKLMADSLEMPEQWVLKTSAAKNLLREQPPKHVMKELGYRSVESLLKREKTGRLFLLASFLESERWSKSLNRLASKLDQINFEIRPMEIEPLSYDSEEPVVVSELTGAVGVSADVPLLPMLLNIAAVLKDYGADPAKLSELNWIIGWWAGTDNLVAALEDGHVSMNVHDVAASWLAEHSFHDRQTLHGRTSYWHNLLEKYENKAHLEEVFDGSVMSRVRKLNFKGPEPAFEFEYAEDL